MINDETKSFSHKDYMDKLFSLIIFPMLSGIYIITNLVLKALNLDNQVIFISCLFLVTHFAYSHLMKIQLWNCNKENSIITCGEAATFASFFTSLVTVFAYFFVGVFPGFKNIMFLLKPLPYSDIWLDHIVMGLPTYLTHIIGLLAIKRIIPND